MQYTSFNRCMHFLKFVLFFLPEQITPIIPIFLLLYFKAPENIQVHLAQKQILNTSVDCVRLFKGATHPNSGILTACITPTRKTRNR